MLDSVMVNKFSDLESLQSSSDKLMKSGRANQNQISALSALLKAERFDMVDMIRNGEISLNRAFENLRGYSRSGRLTKNQRIFQQENLIRLVQCFQKIYTVNFHIKRQDFIKLSKSMAIYSETLYAEGWIDSTTFARIIANMHIVDTDSLKFFSKAVRSKIMINELSLEVFERFEKNQEHYSLYFSP